MTSVSSNEEKTDIYYKEVLISREEINSRVVQLGNEISQDYREGNYISWVCSTERLCFLLT